MIVLDATTKKIQALMDATATTTESPVVCSFDDIASSSTSYTAIASDTITNGATAVDIVAAPGASTQRLVKYINIYNADTVQRTATVRYNDNGTLRILIAALLPVGASLVYANGEWRVIPISLTAPLAVALGGTNSTTALTNGRTMISANSQIIESLGYQTKSAAYTVAITDNNSVLDVDASGSLNLPLIILPLVSSANKGLEIEIHNYGASGSLPIACNSADSIEAQFTNIDSSNGTLAIASFTGGGTTSIVLTMTTDPTLKYQVGGIITVTTGTSIDGTYVISAMSSGSKTISYTRTSSAAASTTTGTTQAVNTWLISQFARIRLQSTGMSGHGAGQGWRVMYCTDWAQTSASAVSMTLGSTATLTNQLFPPGEWDMGASGCIIPVGPAGLTDSVICLSGTSGALSSFQGVDRMETVPVATSAIVSATTGPLRNTPLFPTFYYCTAILTGVSVSSLTGNGRVFGRRVR